jgi:hypothetical protein
MAHQLLYGFCRKCGGMYGTRKGKQVFNDCKCKKIKRKRMDENDFYLMHEAKKNNWDESTKNYWFKRVNDRIKELEPLISECLTKGVDILNLSPELEREWVELHECKEFYQF